MKYHFEFALFCQDCFLLLSLFPCKQERPGNVGLLRQIICISFPSFHIITAILLILLSFHKSPIRLLNIYTRCDIVGGMECIYKKIQNLRQYSSCQICSNWNKEYVRNQAFSAVLLDFELEKEPLFLFLKTQLENLKFCLFHNCTPIYGKLLDIPVVCSRG